MGIDSGAHSFCGTPEYLAPEVLNRSGHGRGVDWWSLGALTYEMLTGLPPFYTKERNVLFERIRKGALEFPDYLSEEAKDLLTGLLNRDPAKRLGCGPGDADEIKGHPWFAGVDWVALYDCKIPPPWVPAVASSLDTSLFDNEFTSMPLVSPSSLREPPLNSHVAKTTFEGFTFVAPSVMPQPAAETSSAAMALETSAVGAGAPPEGPVPVEDGTGIGLPLEPQVAGHYAPRGWPGHAAAYGVPQGMAPAPAFPWGPGAASELSRPSFDVQMTA